MYCSLFLIANNNLADVSKVRGYYFVNQERERGQKIAVNWTREQDNFNLIAWICNYTVAMKCKSISKYENKLKEECIAFLGDLSLKY